KIDILKLVVCSQQNPASAEKVEAGFVTYAKRAQLELKAKKLEYQIAEWEQGWEWGASVNLIGVVRMGKTGKEAIVVSQDSYQEGEGLDNGSSQIQIVGVDEGGMHKLWSTSANVIKATIEDGELKLETQDHEGWRKSGKEIVRTDRVRVGYKDGEFV